MPPRNQHTSARPAAVSGFGYWSGRDVCVEFRPAAADSGIVFLRSNLSPPRRIPATIDYRVEVARRTNLTAPPARVEMVEHVLAALAGLQIDNCQIWVSACEMPGCDGSSKAFVEALSAAGIESQDASRRRFRVTQTVRVGDDRSWVEARPAKTPGLTLIYHLDYGGGPIGRQSFELFISPESFRRELATSRTFVLEYEAAAMLNQGLGRRVTPRDLLLFDDNGPVENELRFENECVRHKMLDLVGDLSLIGSDVCGEIEAHGAGHRLHAELVRALLATHSEQHAPQKKSA